MIPSAFKRSIDVMLRHDLDTSNDRLAAAEPSRRPHVPGEPGLWVFILGEMVVFAILFGIWVHYRNQQPHLFRQSQLELHRYFGAINTLLLLTGSLFIGTAVRAIRTGMRRTAPPLIAAAFVCGTAFLVNKGLEWASLLSHGHSPSANNFFLYFFILTGIHALHLILGMCVLVVLFALSRKPQLSKVQQMIFEGGACYWHVVDVLWIVLFALLYLMH